MPKRRKIEKRVCDQIGQTDRQTNFEQFLTGVYNPFFQKREQLPTVIKLRNRQYEQKSSLKKFCNDDYS